MPGPDSTKELLGAQHAAVLRELDRIHINISGSLAEIKEDMGGVREKMDAHDKSDDRRFGMLENDIGVLKWAYGVGVVIITAIFALLKLM